MQLSSSYIFQYTSSISDHLFINHSSLNVEIVKPYNVLIYVCYEAALKVSVIAGVQADMYQNSSVQLLGLSHIIC